MIKKTVAVLILFVLSLFTSAELRPDVYKIDASRNATIHNNLGLTYVADQNYYDAIQEFTLAIALNPKTQATAVYYNNLGETYMKLGAFREAQHCFESSITQYNLNFLYYQNLVKVLKAQNLIASKIKVYQCSAEKKPLDMIMLGLLYVANGNVKRGVIKLDEFCMREPDLLITSAVRNYINSLVPKE